MPHEPDCPSTNVTLIDRLRSSEDRAAWRAFVDLYTPLVYRYCQARGLQDADVQDVTQDVLSQVSRAIRSFKYDPARGRFRGWLGTIVSHAIGKHRRKADRGKAIGGDDEVTLEPSGERDPAWIDDFNAHVLEAALKRTRPEFDDTTWQSFELTWVNDRPPQEVALAMNKPIGWIYKAQFRVLRQLKEHVLYLTADVGFFARD